MIVTSRLEQVDSQHVPLSRVGICSVLNTTLFTLGCSKLHSFRVRLVPYCGCYGIRQDYPDHRRSNPLNEPSGRSAERHSCRDDGKPSSRVCGKARPHRPTLFGTRLVRNPEWHRVKAVLCGEPARSLPTVSARRIFIRAPSAYFQDRARPDSALRPFERP